MISEKREEKICLEWITGECRNPMKGCGFNNLECPHCLRRNGKDGFGNVLTTPEKAEKVFEKLKDKIEL